MNIDINLIHFEHIFNNDVVNLSWHSKNLFWQRLSYSD